MVPSPYRSSRNSSRSALIQTLAKRLGGCATSSRLSNPATLGNMGTRFLVLFEKWAFHGRRSDHVEDIERRKAQDSNVRGSHVSNPARPIRLRSGQAMGHPRFLTPQT